ncbi:hypothetical protein MXB_4733, partial [Myxobolus squamalis]
NKANEFERAIYGVLAGNINSVLSDEILPICSSYNDILWCLLSCSVYTSVEKVLVSTFKIQGGTSILGQLRSSTHFLLIYKRFVRIEEEIFADVISNYVNMLIRLKKYEIIALYVSLMPVVYQIPTYASALETLKIRGNKHEYIELAKKHGIDHIAVCKTISSNVVSKYLENIKILPTSSDVLYYNLYKTTFDTLDFIDYILIDPETHELEKLLKKSSNILNFTMTSKLYFPRLKSEVSSFLDAAFNLDNILDRIITEALKLIRISEKFSIVLSEFNFDVVSDLPYIGAELKENSFKILSMYTNDILNVIFSVHHFRSNHIKVSHLLAKFPKQLINLISKDHLKDMVKKFAECFTCIDFPDN